MEEEIVIAAEETEGEASTSSEVEEEYSTEEVAIETKELNPADVELMIKKSEIWDKLVRGEIGIDEAKRVFAELSPIAVPVEQGKRRRRKK